MLYDCIVVGGGPAGAVCSFTLQRRGMRCMLLEKRSQIDEKICGGFLPNRCRETLLDYGIDLRELAPAYRVIRGYQEERQGERKTYLYPADRFGLGVYRRDLDSFLLRQTELAGTRIEFGRTAADYQEEDGVFHVNGFEGKRLVWATGAASPLSLRCVDSERVRRRMEGQSLGISEIVRMESASLPDGMVCFWYSGESGDYFWAIPIAEDTWNIGYWSRRERRGLKQRFDEGKRRWIESSGMGLTVLRAARGAMLGNVDFTDCFPGGAAVCCGDLAGMNNEATGEGIAQAIRSGRAAADVVSRSLAQTISKEWESK